MDKGFRNLVSFPRQVMSVAASSYLKKTTENKNHVTKCGKGVWKLALFDTPPRRPPLKPESAVLTGNLGVIEEQTWFIFKIHCGDIEHLAKKPSATKQPPIPAKSRTFQPSLLTSWRPSINNIINLTITSHGRIKYELFTTACLSRN